MNIFSKIKNYYSNLNIIAKASLWFVAVSIFDKGIAVFTQPIIYRILTVEENGLFGVYSSWNSVISVLASFNLFGGVFEVYLTKESNNKNKITSSLCLLSIIICFTLFFIFVLRPTTFSKILQLKPAYIYLMFISIISETILNFWMVSKRFDYEYIKYSVLVVSLFLVKSVLTILLSFYISSDRVFGRILGLVLPSFIVSIIIAVKIFTQSGFKNITEYWKKGFLFNLPLIPHYLSTILLASSDRIMIQRLSGLADSGLYYAAYSFSSLALIVFNAINNAYNPFSMKAIKEKNYSELSKKSSNLVFLSVLFSLIMMLIAPEGLYLLGGLKYMESLKIIPVLIFGIFLSALYYIFSNVEFVYEKNKAIFPITLTGAIVNIGLNYLLISKYGYSVAAYTTVIGYLIISVCHYFVSYKIVGKDIFGIRKILLYILILVAGMIMIPFIYNFHFIIRYIVIVIIFPFGLAKMKGSIK